MALLCTRERNLLLHQQAPQAGSGSDTRRRRRLRITAAACRRRAGRYQNAAALEQPSGTIRLKDGLRQATQGRGKFVVSLLSSRHVFVEYLVENLVELHVPGVRRLVIECQTAKAYTSLASCLPGRGFREI